jgi:hypothetical protein
MPAGFPSSRLSRVVRPLATLALAAVAGAALPRTAAAGPPWIAVERPANPHLEATRGALAVAHLYPQGTATAWPLRAEAIGMVDGVRRTVRLETRAVGSQQGVFAIHGTLPRGDGWVLVITMQADGSSRGSALVALDRRGDVAAVRVPHDSRENGRWLVPREATTAEVDALLRVAVGRSEASATTDAALDGSRTAGLALAGLGVVLLPVGLGRIRRVR